LLIMHLDIYRERLGNVRGWKRACYQNNCI
jgi:hypothetical protein